LLAATGASFSFTVEKGRFVSETLMAKTPSVEGVGVSEIRVPEESPITVDDEAEEPDDRYTGPDPEDDEKGDESSEDQGT